MPGHGKLNTIRRKDNKEICFEKQAADGLSKEEPLSPERKDDRHTSVDSNHDFLINFSSCLCEEESVSANFMKDDGDIEITTDKINSDLSMSLVVGSGEAAVALQQQILAVTKGHEVKVTCQEDAFEICNTQSYVIIWMLMTIPVGQDILSLTTSIRYASKCNKGTVLIGVATKHSTVDLRLHGIDEVIIQPVISSVIRQKYAKWTSIEFATDVSDVSSIGSVNQDLLSEPMTPSTPSTPVSSLFEQDSTRISPNLEDSGIESPASSQQSQHTPSECSTPMLPMQNISVPNKTAIRQRTSNQASDHTTKEKMRRERIKDSCDQLRVLLPYIRGRKTDMASILEMCVDYLKIVNAALPQDFQKQVVDMLSRDVPLPTNTKTVAAAKQRKREAELAATMFHHSPKDIAPTTNNDTLGNIPPRTFFFNSMKRLDPPKSVGEGDSGAKRYCLQPSIDIKALTNQASNKTPLSFQSQVRNSPGMSNNLESSQFQYPGGVSGNPISSLISDYEPMPCINNPRPYTLSDPFPAPNIFSQSSLNTNPITSDRMDSYNLFCETSSLYPYYNSNSLPGNAYGFTTTQSDYINPNTVLSYSSNASVGANKIIKTDTHKYDDPTVSCADAPAGGVGGGGGGGCMSSVIGILEVPTSK